MASTGIPPRSARRRAPLIDGDIRALPGCACEVTAFACMHTCQNCSIEFMLSQLGRLLRNWATVPGGLQLLPVNTRVTNMYVACID